MSCLEAAGVAFCTDAPGVVSPTATGKELSTEDGLTQDYQFLVLQEEKSRFDTSLSFTLEIGSKSPSR